MAPEIPRRQRVLAWGWLAVVVVGQALALGLNADHLWPFSQVNMFSRMRSPWVEQRLSRTPSGPALSATGALHFRQHRTLIRFVQGADGPEEQARRFETVACWLAVPGDSDLVLVESRWTFPTSGDAEPEVASEVRFRWPPR